MSDKLFDGIPTPDEMNAKAFGGTLTMPGTDGDSYLLGYIAALYDQGLIDDNYMSRLIFAVGNGAFSRNQEFPMRECHICGQEVDA